MLLLADLGNGFGALLVHHKGQRHLRRRHVVASGDGAELAAVRKHALVGICRVGWPQGDHGLAEFRRPKKPP
jgi:hypothetical protein